MPTPTKQHQTPSTPIDTHLRRRSVPAALRATTVAALLLVVAATLALSVVAALDTDDLPSGAVRAAVGLLGALVALRAAAWSLVAAAVCLADGTGRAARRAEAALRARAPVLARQLLVGAAGASLVLAPLPASAVTLSPDVAAPPPAAVAVGASATDVLAWPVAVAPRAASTSQPADPVASGRPHASKAPVTSAARTPSGARKPSAEHGSSGVRVVVRPGDTLWGLAAAALPSATDADLVAAWPVLHALNREAIGHDPDLLQPGTELRLPTVDDDGRTFRTTDSDLPETR